MNTNMTQLNNLKAFQTSRNNVSKNNIRLDTLARHSQPISCETKMAKAKQKNTKVL